MKKELFNGKRLKIARVYRGKTIDQVSKETNINKKDILAFEENKYKPTVENALKLSNVLHFPRDYFYRNENIKVNVESVHFNPQSTIQRNEEISYREKLVMIHKLYLFFENYIQFPELQLPDNLNKNLPMEELADRCREFYELGEEPLINMVSFMEAIGVVITDMNIDRRGASPYSQKQSIDGKEKYIVSLGHDKNSLALRNYDLAYEFSFIISNELNIPAKRFNKDDFASALLLPRNKLIEELDNPNELESYLEVKSKFMVPLTIILYRSYALGLINYKKYNYLMNEISKNGWHKEEPLDNVKATHPNCLRKAYKLLLDNNIVSKNTLIEKLYNENMILYGDDLEILMGLKEGSLADKKDVKVLSFNNKNNK
ncbi:XRE family transcriptional regulator [Terrisporobacter sp.]|uniref:XRE family transcriptional regulator n=1 Tax=Terrisporobacter sp. TaxID=1965305 RepID=UPI00289A0CF1|nr:XRE family transcriptional regulator [Terrisporobacter sp.]